MMTEQDISSHIGKRLRHRRVDQRLSLAKVSARCGVSLQQIHRYETGENIISAPMLWLIGQCLGTDVGYFVEDLPPGG